MVSCCTWSARTFCWTDARLNCFDIFAQLEEEAHLLGGTWYPLCDNAETSINADKYSTNEFFCWLVVDPEVTSTPRDMDDEEFIEIERGVSMQTAMAMLSRGEMSAVSGFILLMAERKLRQLGFLNGNY